MRISQLAERSGVPATTLRFYESAGLLPADRTASGYRVYDEPALERLSFIRAAKQVGLPLEEIRDLLSVWDGGACADVRRRMRPLMTGRLTEVTARITDLHDFAGSLRTALAHLDALPDRSTPCDARCTFLRSPADPHHAVPRPPTRPARSSGAGVSVPTCASSVEEQRQRERRWRRILTDATMREPTDRFPRMYGLLPYGQRFRPIMAGGMWYLAAA